MTSAVLSVVGTAAAGSGIKIVAALLQNFFDSALEARKIQHAIRMAELGKEIQAYESQNSNPYTNTTRRWLAFGLCFTLCTIALICTVFPDVPLWTLPVSASQPTEYSILFGLFSWRGKTPSVEAIYITTGSMAVHFVYATTMFLGYYFTPIGKK